MSDMPNLYYTASHTEQYLLILFHKEDHWKYTVIVRLHYSGAYLKRKWVDIKYDVHNVIIMNIL